MCMLLLFPNILTSQFDYMMCNLLSFPIKIISSLFFTRVRSILHPNIYMFARLFIIICSYYITNKGSKLVIILVKIDEIS